MNWGKVAKYLGKTLGETASLGINVSKDASTLLYSGSKKIAKHFMESIPDSEKEELINHIIPWRMKRGHSEAGKRVKNFKIFKNDSFLGKAGNTILKSPATISLGLYDRVLMSPGARLALGIGAAGAGLGMLSGAANDDIQRADVGTIANGIGDNITPGIADVTEKNVQTTGISQYGADASLVFALHNLRNR